MQGIGLKHLEGQGIDGACNQQLIHLLSGSHSHHHRLGRSCRAVVHGGIGDVHPCQFGHHRLILEDIV